MLEMKHELVNLDMAEFSYFDHVLLNMRLLPHEVEVNVPKYYRFRLFDFYFFINGKKKTFNDEIHFLGAREKTS